MNAIELAAALRASGVNPSSYGVTGLHTPRLQQQGLLGLTFEAGEWVIAAYERGTRSEFLRTASEDTACREMYSLLTTVHRKGPVPTAEERVDMARRGRELDARLRAEIAANQASRAPDA